MRPVIIGLFTAAMSFCALQLVYPWATYYSNFEFGWWPTMSSYLIVAVILGGAAAAAAALVLERSGNVTAKGVVCGGAVLTFAAVFALLFGPVGITIPGTRVRGIFFSEWQFLTFVSCVAIPVSINAGLLCWWAAQRIGRPRNKTIRRRNGQLLL